MKSYFFHLIRHKKAFTMIQYYIDPDEEAILNLMHQLINDSKT